MDSRETAADSLSRAAHSEHRAPSNASPNVIVVTSTLSPSTSTRTRCTSTRTSTCSYQYITTRNRWKAETST